MVSTTGTIYLKRPSFESTMNGDTWRVNLIASILLQQSAINDYFSEFVSAIVGLSRYLGLGRRV